MRFRLIQLGWIVVQIGVATWAYSAIREANPDVGHLAIAFWAGLIAFVVTGIPIMIMDLATRLRGRLRRLRTKQSPHQGGIVRLDPP
jgi:hypothetical protein